MTHTTENTYQPEVTISGSTTTMEPLLETQRNVSSTDEPVPSDLEDQALAVTRKNQAHNIYLQLINHWGLELLALAFSLTTFVIMTHLLFKSDGEPISKWTRSFISINTVVSILAGTSKACLAFVISMCLSQGKWNWLGQSARPLIDFDRFDAASRGAWGSFRLLQSCARRPHWVALGAFTAIALLAFEPFTQAVLTLQDQRVTLEADQYVEMARKSNESNGSVPGIGGSSRLDAASWIGLSQSRPIAFIKFLDPNNKKLTHSFTMSSSEVQEDMGMKAAVWNGFSPLITTQSLQPSFTCASGNCSWPNFASIAVCSKCHEISHHIIKTHRMNKIPPVRIPASHWAAEDGESLPDVSNQGAYANHRMTGYVASTKHTIAKLNFSLSNYDGKPRCRSENDNCPDTYLSSRVTTNPGQTITFANLSTMIVAIQYLAADGSWRENRTQWETTEVTAQECALSFCVNEYKAIISQGSLHEDVVSSWMNKSRESFSSDQENVEAFLKYNNNSLDIRSGLVELSDLQINVPDEYRRASNLSEKVFNITHPTIVSLHNIIDEGFGFRKSDIAGCSSETPGTLIYPALGLSNPPSFMVALGNAKHIPTTIENVALSLTKWMRDRQLETSPAVGSATTMVVIIRVRWYFLLVPAISFLLGMVFAILIIWETLRLGRPAFKDSILATLACAPDGDLRSNLQQKAAAGGLQAFGRESKVVWEDNCEISQLREKKVEHTEV